MRGREFLMKDGYNFDIDKDALAAASLAQVHRARIRATGEQICLKIQYPGLADVIDSDFDLEVGSGEFRMSGTLGYRFEGTRK